MGAGKGGSGETDRKSHYYRARFKKRRADKQVPGSCACCWDIPLAVGQLHRSVLQVLLRGVRFILIFILGTTIRMILKHICTGFLREQTRALHVLHQKGQHRDGRACSICFYGCKMSTGRLRLQWPSIRMYVFFIAFMRLGHVAHFAWYEQSSILKGLTPDDISRSAEIIRKRLADYIGNVEAVQAGNINGRTIAAKVPIREFTIESWYVGEEEEEGKRVIAYGLA
jgi:hypothetical protein